MVAIVVETSLALEVVPYQEDRALEGYPVLRRSGVRTLFRIKPRSKFRKPITCHDITLLSIYPCCRYILTVDTAPNHLASRSSPMKGSLFGYVLKGLLGSASVEVTVVAALEERERPLQGSY